MNQYYTATVKYDKIDDQSGKEKSVAEQYLIDALSFTEAEERIHKEMEAYISGEFEVSGLKKEKLSDVFCDTDSMGDQFYLVKVRYIDTDEKSGKSKATVYNMLLNSTTAKQALIELETHLKGIVIPWAVVSIAESPIKDIFFYEETEASTGSAASASTGSATENQTK